MHCPGYAQKVVALSKMSHHQADIEARVTRDTHKVLCPHTTIVFSWIFLQFLNAFPLYVIEYIAPVFFFLAFHQ